MKTTPAVATAMDILIVPRPRDCIVFLSTPSAKSNPSCAASTGLSCQDPPEGGVLPAGREGLVGGGEVKDALTNWGWPQITCTDDGIHELVL